jgi:hypothetical protein
MTESSQIRELADIFGEVTGRFLTQTEHKAELARAIDDRESLVKEQIKQEVLKSVRGIFDVNYRRIAGDEPWC